MGKLTNEMADRVAKRFKQDVMYSPQEVADKLNVSPSLIWRAATVYEELGFVRPGQRHILIPGHEAQKWIKSRWGVKAPRGNQTGRARNTTPIDGNKVRQYRTRRGLSMNDLADRSGVGSSTIGRIEKKGRRAGARIENARALAGALGVKPRSLGVKEAAYG